MIAICRYSKCGKEFELGGKRTRRFCSVSCENAHYRERNAEVQRLMMDGMSEDAARDAVGLKRKAGHSKVAEVSKSAKEREARARRLAERDAAYAREFPDCVGGEWRGQRRIGMFSGLRKAVMGE